MIRGNGRACGLGCVALERSRGAIYGSVSILVMVTSVHLEAQERGPPKARSLVGAKVKVVLDLATSGV